ncbi:reverse transcriptase domain-containing protein [Tanacetum coccineum]
MLLKLDWSKDMKAKPICKTVAFAKSCNDSKLMEKMEALTTKIDSQFKDIKGDMEEIRDGCNSCGGPYPSSECDDNPMGGPKDEEANYAYRGYRGGGYRGNYASIQDLKIKFGRLSDQSSTRLTGSPPSNTQTNPKPSPTNDKPYRPPSAQNEHVNVVYTRSGLTYDLPVNPNAKTAIIYDDSDDEVDEAEKEVEPSSSKQTKSDPLPLKAYKLKIPYPQCLRKEKMEERYAKFIDLIKEVRINVPLIDVLSGMPNYRKFLKDLVINKMKNKELNLGVGDDRITFLIDKAMLHSHSNDDTCFRVDVMDEVTEEELDALLDDSKPFFTTSEKISESLLDHEFKEFMAIKIKETSKQEEKVENSFEVLPLEGNQRIKNSIQEPPTDLMMKPLPEHLEYAFLGKYYLLPVVISALLQDDEKKRLVSVLKKHKEASAWKTSNIPGISPSFCKHKINFEDDAKPIIQRQCRLNPNMKEVIKKEIIKLLDADIIYAIEDSPWVSSVHYVPKKGGMTVVTNEKNEHVPTRTVTGWRICIDYRKLNEATQKDHFSFPFMDQMLERLAGNKFFCFLDGFSATFQRWMIAIFQDMLETSVEVFMYDFSVFGDSFDSCLANLELMLVRCKQAHLVLNWEKCHFMVTEVIVLRHKVSSVGLEVDKAKINTLNNAQQNYTVSEKELLAVVLTFDKFQSYLVLSKTVIFTNHFALKYLFAKQDAKPHLIRWTLLLQEFDIEIKNKKGAENVVADHLSRLENPYLEELRDDDIHDNFPDETPMNVSPIEEDKIPWFADFANYLVGKIVRNGLTYAQRCKFFSELKHYF